MLGRCAGPLPPKCRLLRAFVLEKKMRHGALQQRREEKGVRSGLASAVGSWAGQHARLEAEAQVRKLEEGLRLDQDVPLSTTLLDSRLVDEVRSRDKLEASACHFTKLGGHRLPWIK